MVYHPLIYACLPLSLVNLNESAFCKRWGDNYTVPALQTLLRSKSLSCFRFSIVVTESDRSLKGDSRRRAKATTGEDLPFTPSIPIMDIHIKSIGRGINNNCNPLDRLTKATLNRNTLECDGTHI